MRAVNAAKHRVKAVARRAGWTVENRTDERAFLAHLDVTHNALHPLLCRLSTSPAEADLLAFVIENAHLSNARAFDDLFGWWALRESQNPYFLEAGCWNRTYLNNTYLLEQRLGWSGLLVEPSPKWGDVIAESRTAPLVRAAIVSEGSGMSMVELDHSGESSARSYSQGERIVVRETVSVPTVTLRELLVRDEPMDLFLSLDVEGNEHVLVREIFDVLPPTTALSVEVLNPDVRIRLVMDMSDAGFSLLTPELSHYNMWFCRVGGTHLDIASPTERAVLGWSRG